MCSRKSPHVASTDCQQTRGVLTLSTGASMLWRHGSPEEDGMSQITSDRPADQIASRLLGFDTATLYESAEQPGFMIPDIRPVELGYRVAGPALTVACPGGDNLMLHAAVADARPGEVLVVQCHDLTYGVWGEVLMTAATARGIRALIIE